MSELSILPGREFPLTATPTLAVAFVDDAKTLIDCFHRDLISFLSIAQFHKVDYLPITWDDQQHILGSGATGQVSQLVVNLRTSFAFKRFKKQDKDSMFRELISEVVLLGQGSIRTHPNIVDLEAIAFEVDHNTEEIWPVLVFKKAQFGSLRMFMDSGGGKAISFDRKLKLCSEIGSAIKWMHDLDVIHGDIKPENVLVFGDTVDEITAKVTDFGYSSMGAEDKDQVYLPMTPEWCAPEYHTRGIELHRAKKMDIYSFGMVCLWVLFGEDFTKLRADLGKTKDQGKFQHSAMGLASKAEHLSSDLRAFFDLALRENWQEREADLEKLVLLLGQDISKPDNDRYYCPPTSANCNSSLDDIKDQELPRPLTLADYDASPEDIKDPGKLWLLTRRILQSLHLTGTEYRTMQDHLDSSKFSDRQRTEWYMNLVLEGLSKLSVRSYEQESDTRYALAHSCFNVSEVLYQLSSIDYRVRVHIVECLKRRVIENTCKPCSEEAAFQVAFCYSVGFGIPLDHEEAQLWLQRSPVGSVALERQLDILKRLMPSDIPSGNLSKLQLQGDTPVSPMDTYRNDEQLRKAEAHFEREIRDLESCLGQGHILTFMMRRILQSLKEALEKRMEAEEIGWKLKHDSEEALEPGHPFTLSITLYLANKCRIHGKWEQAEKLVLEAKELMEKTMEPGHPFIMEAAEILSFVYSETGKTNEAEKASGEVAHITEKVYGPSPRGKLVEICNVGWRHMMQGDLEAAEDLLFHVKQESEKLFGFSCDVAMMATRNLALTYRNQGRILEAERMQVALKETIEKALGLEAQETLNVIYDLARTYMIQEKWAEAAEMELKVVEGRKKNLGPNHTQTIDASSRLAIIYTEQGKLREAEGVLVRIMVAKENSLGRFNPETLEATRNLSVMYWRQGKLQQAEELMTELKIMCEDVLGPEHEETLGSMSNIGEVYRCQGRFKEAEEILLKAKEIMERALGPGHSYTKTTTNILVRTYLNQGKLGEAFTVPNPKSLNTSITPNFVSFAQRQDLSEGNDEDEEKLLNAAIQMSLEPISDKPETDEDEIVRKAIYLSLQNDDE